MGNTYLDAEGVKYLWGKTKELSIKSINTTLDDTINNEAKTTAKLSAESKLSFTFNPRDLNFIYSIRETPNSFIITTADITKGATVSTPNSSDGTADIIESSGLYNTVNVKIFKDKTLTVTGSYDANYSYSYPARQANFNGSEIEFVDSTKTISNQSKNLKITKTFTYKAKDNAAAYYVAAVPQIASVTGITVTETGGGAPRISVLYKATSNSSITSVNATAWNGAEKEVVSYSDGNKLYILISKGINANCNTDPNKTFQFKQAGDWNDLPTGSSVGFKDDSVNTNNYTDYKWFVKYTTGFYGSLTLKVK